MGLDAQKSFAQMYEDGNTQDRVGKQVMQLNPIVVQKTREEIRARDSKLALKIGRESDDFARIFIRTTLAQGRTPLDHRSRMQKTFIYKGL